MAFTTPSHVHTFDDEGEECFECGATDTAVAVAQVTVWRIEAARQALGEAQKHLGIARNMFHQAGNETAADMAEGLIDVVRSFTTISK